MKNIQKQKESNIREVTPFEQMASLRNRMERLFDEIWSNPFSVIESDALRRTSPVQLPRIDIEESESEIKITADVPGFSEDTISVEVGDRAVSISGRVTSEHSEKIKNKLYVRYERYSDSFSRIIPLSTEIDPEKCTAEVHNGVLNIILPKVTTAPKKKKISVKKK